MNHYVSFVKLDKDVEMVNVKADTRKILSEVLRGNGYNVYVTMTKPIFDYYRSRPACEFFEKYFLSRSDEFCMKIFNLMYK
jgi:hypothetical protein